VDAKKGKPLSVAEAGRRGGRARAGKQTPEERKALAVHANQVRWSRKRKKEEEDINEHSES
jgi:hypothetical protein